MTTYRDEVLADTPSHYWGLGDALGSATLASVLTGGVSLTINGTPSLQQPSLVLGSSDKAVKLGTAYLKQSGSNQAAPNIFTLEAVIKTTRVPSHVMGHANVGVGYDRMLYIGTSGRLILACYASGQRYVIGNNVVADGEAHHIAGRVDANGVYSVFVDGKLAGSGTFTQTINAYSGVVYIGGGFSISGWPETTGTDYSFDGVIDEPAVYRGVALSDERIAEHARIALRPARLAGKAVLDTGAAATRVLARSWDDDAIAGSATPASDGTWSLYVAPGSYEVTFRGPPGYQPVTHGPVVADAD